MSTLNLYRDDGPLASAIARVLPTRWVTPFVLGFYALLLVVPLITRPGATPTVGFGLSWFIVVAGCGAARDLTKRLDWLVPVIVRAAEYAFILAVVRVDAPEDLPYAYAVLAASAFHHYDIVYRLRHQGMAPPTWVNWAGGGWELRMVTVYLLAFNGWLHVGLPILAFYLFALFVTESVRSWFRATMVLDVEEQTPEAGGD